MTFEPYNSYSHVVSVGYPTGVSNSMMQNFTPVEKMSSGRLPMVSPSPPAVIITNEKEKTVNSEVVEIVPTNSSSVPGIISPDLLPFATACGDNTNALLKK